MDFFSQTVEQYDLVKGDHIYSYRKLIYSHHGIFSGDGAVIHFVNPQEKGSVRSSSSIGGGGGGGGGGRSQETNCRASDCGLEKVVGSGVRLSCLDCFLKKGSLYRYRYNVSGAYILAKLRTGTCTTAKSDPSKEVIRRAIYLYENGYKEYHLINNNCEDFALYCKTGLWSTNKQRQGRSSQTHKLVDSFVLNKWINDLGVRDDVVKVAVENLSSFIRALK